MLSIATNRFVASVITILAFGWGGTASAAKVETEAKVVAKLYRDFAWQALTSQSGLFGDSIEDQSKFILEKYFTPALADLLVKDVACQVRLQGICNLNVDILFDSQDPRVMDLAIATIAPGKVAVTFKDPTNDDVTKIEFLVNQVAGRWKISDIVYKKDGWSLTKVLLNKIP